MRTITSMEELKSLVGQKVAVTDWFAITQERINLFADATDDHQWIHQDAGRCREESPYGTTVAHGFLTLSLLPAMLASAITMPAARVTLNYGGQQGAFPCAGAGRQPLTRPHGAAGGRGDRRQHPGSLEGDNRAGWHGKTGLCSRIDPAPLRIDRVKSA